MSVTRRTRIVVIVLILGMIVFGAFGVVRSCASDMPSGTTDEDQLQKPELQRPRTF